MKKTLFTFLFVMFATLLLNAQMLYTVGGYVTTTNGGAVANHTVYIWSDSTSAFPFYTSAVTNSNGFYSINITGLPGTSTLVTIHVATYDCNNAVQTQNVTNANPQNTVNFSICVNATSTCQANYSFTPSSAGNNSIAFHDLSTGTPTSWTWSFGDGTTGSGANITHTYNATGNYIVCLYITTASGCSSHFCDTISVNVPTTNSCHAAFQYYLDSLLAASHVYHFSNYSTSSYVGYAIAYSWNFGDGTTSTLANPTHQFAANPTTGGYHVCLTIKVYPQNTPGTIVCQDSTCYFVQVSGTTPTCTNTITSTHTGLTYTFTGTVNPAGQTTYSWNFGDGSTGSGQNVTHTFTQPVPGTAGYNVCLITTTINSNGTSCTATSCQYVSIANTAGTIIQGHVYAGNYPANGYVVLYQANNATMGYTIFDTLALDSSGYFIYNYANVPPTTPAFIIKAFLNASSPLYTQYFPTYYVHTLNWYNAAVVSPSASTVYFNINLIPVPSGTPIGNGTIGGNVSNGNLKAASVSGVPVILMDANDNPLKIQNTDANGNYAFNELVAGSYKVVVEMLGSSCTIVTVTLSTSNQNSTGNNFVVNGTTITASVEESVWLSNHISEIYPNPSASNASLDFSLLKSSVISIKAFNNLGQVVLVNEAEYTAGAHKVLLNTNDLAVGIYTIQISANNTTKIVKKFVKTR